MNTFNQRRWPALILALVVAIPLTAIPLDALVSDAMAKSKRMQDLELSKQNALLTLGLSRAKTGVSVSVDSGTFGASYDIDDQEYNFSNNGLGATFVLPNDGKTSISITAGKVSYSTVSKDYSVNPSVSANHTITYGLTTDRRKDLLNEQTRLLAEATYYSGQLNFRTQLYTYIGNILSNEQSLAKAEKELADLKKSVEQNLALKLLREGSLVHQAQIQQIRLKESTIESLKATGELLKKQYQAFSGLVWQGVDEIPGPTLDFAADAEANSTVKQKKLAWDIAKEDLELKKAEFTNKNLVLGGTLGYSDSQSSTNLGVILGSDVSAGVSATLASKNFKVSGGVGAIYDIKNNNTQPYVSIGGSWNNNPTTEGDVLTLQKLQNEVSIAELAYNVALDDYQQQASSLSSSIANWQMQYELLKLSMQYNRDALAQQKTLFEKGLATKESVDDAQFAVDQDAYTLKTTLLEGLKLENQIRSLNI